MSLPRLSQAEQRALVETLYWSETSRPADSLLDKLVAKGLVRLGPPRSHERTYIAVAGLRPLIQALAADLGETTSLVADRHLKERPWGRYPCGCWACIARREYLLANNRIEEAGELK